MITQPIRRTAARSSLSKRTVGGLLLVVAALFLIAGAIALHLSPYPRSLRAWQLAAMVVGWTVAWGGSYALLSTRLAEFDIFLLAITALLTGWGLLLQARLAPAVVVKQVLWLVLGAAIMCGITLVPTLTRLLRRYRYTLLTAGLVLLGATLVFGVNPSGFGQELWLGAFGLFLQPSEPLKLLLVIFLAAYLADKREVPRTEEHPEPMWIVVLGPVAAMVGVALLLLGWQQDLGAALLFYLTSVTMIYLAWGKGKYVALSLLLFLPIAVGGYYLSDRVALRISIWLDPWAPEQADRAFQILQSLFAVSAGGLFGEGLGQGSPGLIPAVHTDFVYAALMEEFGLLGAMAFIVLIALFVTRGIRLAQRADSPFEALLAGGIAALIGIQTWVIVGGNIKLIPITGVTLPFFSYGGSSLVTMLTATGLLLNLSTPHRPPLALSLAPNATRPLTWTAARLGQSLLVLLTTLAVGSGAWAVIRAGELRAYPTNPRFILAESRIRRGQILDRNADVVADIVLDDEGYVTRTYPVAAAAPVVGYATFEYGTDGIEDMCDARLRGEIDRTPWDAVKAELLHQDPVGRSVRLTVDARLQRQAQGLLADHVGAAVVLDTHTGDILALASSPIYDPATVAAQWDQLRQAENSPFLNRATEGLAQPGTILQPLILGAAWMNDPTLTPAEPITRPVTFNGSQSFCRAQPDDSTWQEAIGAACPAPFAALAEAMTPTELQTWFTSWGLLDPPALALPTVAVDLPANATLDPAAEALGQGQILITPLQLAGAVAAMGNDGVRPDLQILDAPYDGCATPRAEAIGGTRVLSAEVADQILQIMPQYNGAVGHLGTSLAGPERRQAWFAGWNSPTLPRYGVVVFIDRVQSPRLAADIGTELLEMVSDLY